MGARGINTACWAAVALLSLISAALVVLRGVDLGDRRARAKASTHRGAEGKRLEALVGGQQVLGGGAEHVPAQECFHLDGAMYRGRASTTRSGKRCQRWDAQEPNVHDVQRYADLFGAPLEENFCRNPSGESGGPWCYNAEGTEPPWETCGIPRCEGQLSLPVNVTVRLGSHDGAGSGGARGAEGRLFECPRSFLVSAETYSAMRKYELLTKEAAYDPKTSQLHFFSLYGATSLAQWDALVWAHVHRLGYKAGESVFEAGSAAGAFVDSLRRQFGVRVSGVDVSQAAVRIARDRLEGTFCAADAASVPFVPSESFDHALSFAVLMYARDVVHACSIAQELIRVVRPGGTVFLGQINDPDMRAFAPEGPEGSWEVPALFWHRFAYAWGHDIEILKGEDVYSRRTIPLLDHYDLHASLRYNVYLRKGARRGGALDCAAFRSGAVSPRTVEGGGVCALPFTYCGGGCKDAEKGLLLDDCTTIGDVRGREWCRVLSENGEGSSLSRRGYCTPLAAADERLF